jgi:hypothetical protein
MPSVSAKQHRFMEAVKHSPTFAKKAGVPQSVGRDFAAADDKAGITKSHNYDAGGEVGRLPTYGISSSYPPPIDYRKQGPREYPK